MQVDVAIFIYRILSNFIENKTPSPSLFDSFFNWISHMFIFQTLRPKREEVNKISNEYALTRINYFSLTVTNGESRSLCELLNTRFDLQEQTGDSTR